MSLTLARINPRHIPQGVICYGFIYVKFSKLYLNGKERMTIFASLEFFEGQQMQKS